jgi:outer membrane immunogenic protein
MKLVLATASAALISTAAAAQWNGPYIGANIGYGWGESNADVALGGAWASEPAGLQSGLIDLWSTTQNPDGLVYGGQAGYNLNFSGFVLGAEVDYSKLDINESRLLPLTATSFGPMPTYGPGNSIDANHLLALKAKLGVATGSWLFYATGGWAMVNSEGTAEVTSSGGYSKFGSDKGWRSGVVYGGGVEVKVSSNWSARVEYLRGDFSDFEYATDYRPGSTFTSPVYSEAITQDLDLNLVRAAINFHF